MMKINVRKTLNPQCNTSTGPRYNLNEHTRKYEHANHIKSFVSLTETN